MLGCVVIAHKSACTNIRAVCIYVCVCRLGVWVVNDDCVSTKVGWQQCASIHEHETWDHSAVPDGLHWRRQVADCSKLWVSWQVSTRNALPRILSNAVIINEHINNVREILYSFVHRRTVPLLSNQYSTHPYIHPLRAWPYLLPCLFASFSLSVSLDVKDLLHFPPHHERDGKKQLHTL